MYKQMWYAVCPNNVHLISMKDEKKLYAGFS